MSRLQRNMMKRARRRTLFFSLLICAAIFVSGVWITNDVMVRMTGLEEEENILSFQNMQASAVQVMEDYRVEEKLNILGAWMKDFYLQLLSKVRGLTH